MSTADGGARGRDGMSPTSQLLTLMHTRHSPPDVPKDVRSTIAQSAERLTERMLACGEGKESKDRYVKNVRRDIKRQKAVPFHMLCAASYSAIMELGRSAEEVTAWAQDYIAWCHDVARSKDADRVQPESILPLLVQSQRKEALENEVETLVAADEDNPVLLERLLDASDQEMAAERRRNDVMRQRYAQLMRDLRGEGGKVSQRVPHGVGSSVRVDREVAVS